MKPKHIRFKTVCNCGYTSVDDSNEPIATSHTELIKAGFKYRRFKNGDHYYLSLNKITDCTGHYED